MTDQASIYEATLACHKAIRESTLVPSLAEWAENCIADFNLWAGGAGALKIGKASLDARLSSRVDAKAFVVNLLGMLQAFVKKCIEIGNQQSPPNSELSQSRNDVKLTIGQLSRITSSIRKAGVNARIQKADGSYDPDNPQIQALRRHLQLLLLARPCQTGALLATTSPDGIKLLPCGSNTSVADTRSLTAVQKRLIEANLKRRNRFLYAQRHAMKLSERDQVQSAPTSSAPSRKVQLPLILDARRDTPEQEIPNVHSETTATDVQEPIELPTQASAELATTVVSAISSRVTYPKPPAIKEGQNVFQCPCCCQSLPTAVSRGGHWKKHLASDILPYTCILEDCPYPERLYHEKGRWMSHMFKDHGGTSHWVCLACRHPSERPTFYEQAAFVSHLQDRHSKGITSQQIPILVSAWLRKTQVTISPCPLCGFDDGGKDTILTHTAEHLHSFSLRSLPWARGENPDDDDLCGEYFDDHPYFDMGPLDNSESQQDASSSASRKKESENNPSNKRSPTNPNLASGLTPPNLPEDSQLTEENIRSLLKGSSASQDLANRLDAFLDAFENQDHSEEAFSTDATMDIPEEPSTKDMPQESFGDYGEDTEFAATLAAGAAAAGSDPALVTDDPIYHTRSSPPSSQTPVVITSPRADSPLHQNQPHGFIEEGKVKTPGNEGTNQEYDFLDREQDFDPTVQFPFLQSKPPLPAPSESGDSEAEDSDQSSLDGNSQNPEEIDPEGKQQLRSNEQSYVQSALAAGAIAAGFDPSLVTTQTHDPTITENNSIEVHNENYFDHAFQLLHGDFEAWVVEFSEQFDHSCRTMGEIHDEKIVDRFENAILDGSDVDKLLSDTVHRRDVFMTVLMNMVWEFVFTRYLFGIKRQIRQHIKQLEKGLSDSQPKSKVNRWRATTLSLLANAPATKHGQERDSEAVALEIFKTLCRVLPPPAEVEEQLFQQLHKLIRNAGNLSVQMRAQLADYMMLPPLQPEFDSAGDLVNKIYFNASLMNDRSGRYGSNQEAESQQAVVRMVLFPLVVKKGDDQGEGDDEIIVYPAQVVVDRKPRDRQRVGTRLESDDSIIV